MIVMNLKLDNIFSFNNFHINMTYPKRIVNSNIEHEYLTDRPKFRYKKVIILMGANASGKTTLGRALMGVFNFISKKNIEPLAGCINDVSKNAYFSIEFVASLKHLFRIEAIISPPDSSGYKEEDIVLTVKSVPINKTDTYETCVKKLDKQENKELSYIKALDEVEPLGWFFSYPDLDNPIKSLKGFDKETFLKVMRIVLKTLDPSIKEVREGTDIEDTYIIRLHNRDLIIQGEKVLNDRLLSSGTKSGIDIAIMISSIITNMHGFYYCDEKFSFIHSDIEKEILSIMISILGPDEQLFFTTHNTDILDIMLPKHSFVFLKKEVIDGLPIITSIHADSFIKRNTDLMRTAVENDLFSIAPRVSNLDELINIKEE